MLQRLSGWLHWTKAGARMKLCNQRNRELLYYLNTSIIIIIQAYLLNSFDFA